ncbi:phosphoribosylformylglycinamidine synthase [Marinicella gelatinilytica]|uniref:phosphoribosylformylglycinamidine synthase n=1 Tax=Marinicella gelatinilytica TaxID=2996017 RepID=UPI002260FFA9|nr:phosphoribosylformylglycinamidine synthase [Marinicella gelatinilytica]MCX7544090.1 phosphoribosylformylglycinamidine synthase [Marinicella gelatinilytica]
MSLTWVTLLGGDAFSTFKKAKLNEIAQENNWPEIVDIKSVYVLEVSQTLVPADRDKIVRLLNAQTASLPFSQNTLTVFPRPGTISPWSSKATDIFHHCGLHQVRRVEAGRLITFAENPNKQHNSKIFYDRMTEALYQSHSALHQMFDHQSPKELTEVPLDRDGDSALHDLNKSLGLALSNEEISYLSQHYQALGKNPTDVELMMFAQANSEHCRHKIFNADWTIDSEAQAMSLFKMIKNTEARTSEPALSAYKDNAAVFSGGHGQRLIIDKQGQYQKQEQLINVLIKVETHNHPTAIEPFAGAATGSGGEIRDEAATGQGAMTKAGLTGFSVSHLNIPGNAQPWEQQLPGKPNRMASAFDIMQKGPIGAAAFNNEFGRPNIVGYFRSFEIKNPADDRWRGYHKPIMLAGGMGSINDIHTRKQDTQAGDYIIVLGGPAMLIGLGGGAASSVSSADGQEELDFASVQRGNPEMQRRCQEVINRCWYRGDNSPIRSIHDVGAGGLSNAIPEILDDAQLGGDIELRRLQIDHVSMSPMEIWCNESQERYVLSIKPELLHDFKALCEQERCPVAVMGQATAEQTLRVSDALLKQDAVNIPMDLLFGNTPQTDINITTRKPLVEPFKTQITDLWEAINQVLSFPTVASKQYLITIGDRTVTGLVHRDQMVGPWQIPVANCGITLRDYDGFAGEAMAIGERTPLALLNPAASARMAVTEALTNLAGTGLRDLSQVKLSANWMVASSEDGEFQALYEAVEAIGMALCPQLDIGIPVGKDSMSMHTSWRNDFGQDCAVTSPLSLVISAFAPLNDVRHHLTPQLSGDKKSTILLIDLAAGQQRLGGSVLYQIQNQLGENSPDLDQPELLKQLFAFMADAIEGSLLSACHDRSDGGLITTLAEMCFAGHCGMDINISGDVWASLFNEEPGVVVEVKAEALADVESLLDTHNLSQFTVQLGQPNDRDELLIKHDQGEYRQSRGELQKIWSQTSHEMATRRDHSSDCESEFALISEINPGISPQVDFDFSEKIMAPYINSTRPKVAILREQGVNGQNEMAAAFMRAGFDCDDVPMSLLISGTKHLSGYQGIVACGGFSYGDVLGAGQGWAKSILFNQALRTMFSDFFQDNNRFALGVCNGCQMFSGLREIIPGTSDWPDFVANHSGQFEARFSSLRIADSHNMFFKDMAGAVIPVAIAHGEGRAVFDGDVNNSISAAHYADNQGKKTMRYPFNPNGSESSVAAVSNDDGRVLAMMPHPERVFRGVQMSWSPSDWQDSSPWQRMFYNARMFLN